MRSAQRGHERDALCGRAIARDLPAWVRPTPRTLRAADVAEPADATFATRANTAPSTQRASPCRLHLHLPTPAHRAGSRWRVCWSMDAQQERLHALQRHIYLPQASNLPAASSDTWRIAITRAAGRVATKNIFNAKLCACVSWADASHSKTDDMPKAPAANISFPFARCALSCHRAAGSATPPQALTRLKAPFCARIAARSYGDYAQVSPKATQTADSTSCVTLRVMPSCAIPFNAVSVLSTPCRHKHTTSILLSSHTL